MSTRFPKLYIWLSRAFNEPEIATAIFVIFLFTISTLANFAIGFFLPLFLLAAFSSLILVSIYPRSGVYAIVVLTFIFERFFTLQSIVIGRNSYKLYPLDALLGAVIIGILFYLISGKIKLKIERSDKLLISFMALCGITFLFSITFLGGELTLAFSSFKNYGFYPILYFVISRLFNERIHLERLFKFSFAGALGIIPFIVYGLISGVGLWSGYTPLSTEGTRTLAFTHALFSSLVFIGLFAFYSYKENLISKKYLTVMMIWMVGILGSMMRHLWGGIFVAFIVLFILSPPIGKRSLVQIVAKLTVFAAASLLVLIFLTMLFPGSRLHSTVQQTRNVIEYRVNSLFAPSKDESYSWRNSVWGVALEEFAKKPITGIGFGQVLAVEKDDYGDYVEARNVHNSFLALFVQVGVIPFAIFILFILDVVKKIANKKHKDWIEVVLLSLLVYYFVIMIFQPYLETNLLGIFFWIILGIFGALNNRINLKHYAN